MGIKNLTIAKNIIIFLDSFLAFMIILGSGFIIQTDFGKASILFGFIMLVSTTALKIMDYF